MNINHVKLAFLIIFVFHFPFVFAAGIYSGGNGSDSTPYLISDANDMQEIGANPDDWSSYFLLTNDIDLSAFDGLDGRPQYNLMDNFTGNFDGQGHTIHNFSYSVPTIETRRAIGLFGYTPTGAVIKNLRVEDVRIVAAGSNHVGAIQGEGTVEISNCFVSGLIVGDFYVGGMSGYNSNGSFDNCHVDCTVIASGAGGLVGQSYKSLVSNCSSSGFITGIEQIGGLVGRNYGTIQNSWSSAKVEATDYRAGGITCIAGGPIINCYSTGNVKGSTYIGGIAGTVNNAIQNCYASGTVIGTDPEGEIGGVAGDEFSSSASYIASFWDNQVNPTLTGIGNISDPNEIIGQDTLNMKKAETYTTAGWNFVDTWEICQDKHYPRLQWQPMLVYNGDSFVHLPANFQGQLRLDLESHLDTELSWTIDGYDSCGWITSITPVSGSLINSSDTAAVTINIDTTGLSEGNYVCDCTLSGGNGDIIPIRIKLTVYDKMDLEEFAGLSYYWLTDGCIEGQPCDWYDWHDDNIIDHKDLEFIARCWLGRRTAAETYEDFETGDFDSLNWQLSGDLPWVIVSDTAFEGSFSAKSGLITDDQISVLELTLDTTGLDKISFACKISSEYSYDCLNFYIDGILVGVWYSEYGWTVVEYPIADGQHTFRWEYAKDSSRSRGTDCTWIDNIRIFDSSD